MTYKSEDFSVVNYKADTNEAEKLLDERNFYGCGLRVLNAMDFLRDECRRLRRDLSHAEYEIKKLKGIIDE